jgi:hypothetical protein
VITDNAGKAEENKTKVYDFATRAEFDDFSTKKESENCFGLFFNKVDTANFDYEVVTGQNKFGTIDTNKPLITPLISKPDMTSWGQYVNTVWLFPYITDFLARYQAKFDFTDKSEFSQRPWLNQDIGYTPAPAQDYVQQNEAIFRTLIGQFPQFVQYNQLSIFMYIIQGMVGEKETKARQGMKIMGL